MKKLIALLALVCVMMLPFAAMAEEINWADMQPAIEELGLKGDFIALEDMGLMVWIPSTMAYYEPSAEDAEAGRYAIFADDECALTIDVVNVEGMTPDQALANAQANGMTEAGIDTVNGLSAVIYLNEAQSLASFVLVDTNCNMIIFSFTPVKDDLTKLASSIIFASIMPME